MSEQTVAGLGYNESGGHGDAGVNGGESNFASFEKQQAEALGMLLEEFRDGIMQNEQLLDAVITRALSINEKLDTSDLEGFTVLPYLHFNEETGGEERGIAVKISNNIESEELPETSAGFTLLEHIAVIEWDEQGKRAITRSFVELIVGQGSLDDRQLTEDEKARVVDAARTYVSLVDAFEKGVKEQGIATGVGPDGTPGLMSELERTAFDSR